MNTYFFSTFIKRLDREAMLLEQVNKAKRRAVNIQHPASRHRNLHNQSCEFELVPFIPV